MKRWTPMVMAMLLVALGLGSSPEAHTAERLQEATTRVVLPAAQDTHVQPGIEDPLGRLGELWAGLPSPRVVLQTFIQFEDFPDLGPDATVVDAELRLWCIRWEHRNDPRREIKELEIAVAGTSWDEDTLHARSRIPRAFPPKWDHDFGDCAEGGEWKSVMHEDLSKIAQSWYDGLLDNDGIIISPTRDDNLDSHWMVIQSRDGELPPPFGKGPQLVVQFDNVSRPTLEPSITPTASNTPTPTNTPIPTDTLTPTATPTDTPTPTQTFTPSPTPTPAGIFLPLGMRNEEVKDTTGVEPPPATQAPEPTMAPTAAGTEETPGPTMEPTATATMAMCRTCPDPALPSCTPGPVPTACPGPNCPTPAPCPVCCRR